MQYVNLCAKIGKIKKKYVALQRTSNKCIYYLENKHLSYFPILPKDLYIAFV